MLEKAHEKVWSRLATDLQPICRTSGCGIFLVARLGELRVVHGPRNQAG